MTFVEKCIIFCILTLFAFLLTGCVTYEPKVKLPVGLPVGYSLVVDYEGNIRVVLPDGRVTNGKWGTVEIAVGYARCFEEWSTSYTK